ncbi:efflux pump antibiotic resistance protein [Apiospora kogelbergensis]|uniref:efflux pump antibiotic resistance protein n=1 Tax=Apiospora kogelbergensis TaxID=1337665 RepID=UPI00312F2E8F
MSQSASPDKVESGNLSSHAEKESAATITPSADNPIYIQGWRLHAITAGLCMGLFLVNFEVTVVGTALVSITNDLQDFAKSSWIVTAYLLTYTGMVKSPAWHFHLVMPTSHTPLFYSNAEMLVWLGTGCLVIWARVSDFIGRKPACMFAFFIFAAFSGACGGAQSMTQLIIFRVFQGIGGSGIYGLTTAMLYELVPPPRYPLYTTYVMTLFAIAFALGPVFGGLITNRGVWRWVFLLNVPAAFLMMVLLFFVVPDGFPYHGRRAKAPRHSIKAFDFVGSFLTLAGIGLLITGLEEAASDLAWVSSRVLGPLCASGVAWVLFLLSQWRASRPDSGIQPVFPWRFCQNRAIMGLFINTFMTGAVSVTCVVLIPLRYQTAGALSPLDAGVRLILFSAVSPIGAIVAAMLCKKKRTPPLFVMLFGALLQILGLVLVTTLAKPDDRDWPGLYGLQVCIGFGMGFAMGTATLLTPAITERRDLAVASAAVVQFRFLGGAVVLSTATAVGNSWIRSVLAGILSPEQLMSLFRSTETINSLEHQLQDEVRGHFVQSFNLQMRVVLGVAVAAFLSATMMWKHPQIRVP